MTATRIVVDGETFLVVPRHPGADTYDFTWVEGRHNGDYGFTSATLGASGSDPKTEAWMHSAVRQFLAQVDPQNGFIE